jgi:hypothetical protein
VIHSTFRLAAWLAVVSLTLAVNLQAEIHPIVEVGTGYLLGATADGKWIKAEDALKKLEPSATYRVYSLTEALGEQVAAKPTSIEEPCPDVYAITQEEKPEKGAIALAAPWDAQPRKVRVADTTQQVYIDAMRDFLKGRGFKEPRISIVQILRVDLDGDGEDEVLISATNYGTPRREVPFHAAPGSYSFVVLRQVVNGKVQTRLVAGEFYPPPKRGDAPNYYEVSAVLDLDGDGKMEVVVHSGYYEGGATTIYRCGPGKIAELLSVGCGV